MNYKPVIEFIRSLYPNRESIPLHEPYFGGNEKKYVLDCIDSTFVSSVGKYVTQFEEMISEFTGAKYAIATVNGTAALHIALLLAGVKRDDLVITQPLTFIATCNAISYCGAEPVLIDIDRKTLGLSAESLEKWLAENGVLAEENGKLTCFYLPRMNTNERSRMDTNDLSKVSDKVDKHLMVVRESTKRKHCVSQTDPQLKQSDETQTDPSFVSIRDLSFVNIRGLKRISACVPMHTFGHPCDIDRIVEVCNRYHIPVVEDAAESIGSYYKNQHTGIFGQLGILSFNGNKTITTGGGGMILTNDDELGSLAKHITTTAKKPHPWKFEHDMVGYNYRMPNINAALGCAQMEMLPTIMENKRATALAYLDFFSSFEGIDTIPEPIDSISNYWLNLILLNGIEERDQFLKETNDNKVTTRPAWILMNELEMFKNCTKSDLTISQEISNRLVNIPSSMRIT